MTWKVTVTHDNNGINVYEKQYLSFIRARRQYKRIVEQMTMMYGYPMARGTAYRFMSFTFQIIKDMIVYDAMDKDYSIKYNIIRVTIIHTKEEDYDCEAILGEYELDFNYLNNRWRKYDRDDE